MRTKNNNIADPKRRRGALFLALLPVVLLQLSLAGHQFEHVAEALDQSCHVCVQLDRVDDADASTSGSMATLSAGVILVRPATVDVFGRALIRGFESRGPPQSLIIS